VCVAHIGNFRLAGQKAQMLPHLASYLFSLAPHFVVETAFQYDRLALGLAGRA
jgi:hypothetical protein